MVDSNIWCAVELLTLIPFRFPNLHYKSVSNVALFFFFHPITIFFSFAHSKRYVLEYSKFCLIQTRYTRAKNVWVPSILLYKFWMIFVGMKQFLFLKKEIQNGWLKKTEFFKTANSQYFFSKFSGIDPWVSRINWCKGIDVVVRLSDIRSETG